MKKKIILAGGTGQIGQILARAYIQQGHEVVVLSRTVLKAKSGVGQDGLRLVEWDARTLGPWVRELEGSDLVVNLAGRSVNCRYTQKNLDLMLSSRVDSANAIGEACLSLKTPPKIWMQMSTATIYSHRFDQDNDEWSGEIGGEEPGVPDYWAWSIKIAKEWEAAQKKFELPKTRKLALRTAMVMSGDEGGVFSILRRLARLGLGGAIGGGTQYVSWIHEADFVQALQWIESHPDLEGPINIAAPGPLPQKDQMNILRRALGVPIGLPATKWIAEIGAWLIRTDTELLLKSRRVRPGKLLKSGFLFQYPTWKSAVAQLVSQSGSNELGLDLIKH